jgi:pyruvate/2-oxoglutarate dehydrogenase complex dihydrolipoamide acyltransferase (E2) component
VPDQREYVGNVRAVDAVEVRARVRGYLIEQHFEDGKLVKKGDLLFKIDPSTYQVALAGAKGDLARAAPRPSARGASSRAPEQLVKDDVASIAVLDARRAERDAAEAEIASASARVHAAELNLSYTSCARRSRAGSGARSSTWAIWSASRARTRCSRRSCRSIRSTSTSRPPSAIGSACCATSRRAASRAERGRAGVARARRRHAYPHQGAIDFVDPTIEPTRGTVAVRARVPNPDGRAQARRVRARDRAAPRRHRRAARAAARGAGPAGRQLRARGEGDGTVESRPVQLGACTTACSRSPRASRSASASSSRACRRRGRGRKSQGVRPEWTESPHRRTSRRSPSRAMATKGVDSDHRHD